MAGLDMDGKKENKPAADAEQDDLIYISDPRWWFGGLRSTHSRALELSPDDAIHISQEALEYAHFTEGQVVAVEKIL